MQPAMAPSARDAACMQMVCSGGGHSLHWLIERPRPHLGRSLVLLLLPAACLAIAAASPPGRSLACPSSRRELWPAEGPPNTCALPDAQSGRPSQTEAAGERVSAGRGRRPPGSPSPSTRSQGHARSSMATIECCCGDQLPAVCTPRTLHRGGGWTHVQPPRYGDRWDQ